MDFTLDQKHEMARDLFKQFAETEVKPLAHETDETEVFPAETVAKMGKYGFMGIPVPKEYGGQGCDPLTYVMCVEELSKVCGTTGVIVSAHTSLCIDPIMTFGTEEQKKKYVPDLASGKKIGAFGLTEPGAGTDAQGCQTKAVLDGDKHHRGQAWTQEEELLCIHRRQGNTWIFIRNKREEDGYPRIIYIRAYLRGCTYSKGCITWKRGKRFPNRYAYT